MRVFALAAMSALTCLTQDHLAIAGTQGVKARLLWFRFQPEGATGLLQVTAGEREVRGFRLVLVSSEIDGYGSNRVATWDWTGSLQPEKTIDIELKSTRPGTNPKDSRLLMSFVDPKLDLGLSIAEQAELRKYPSRIQKAIKENKIVMGMTARQLELSWGKPESINSTVLPGHRMDQWVYGLGTYVYLQNGKVSSWQTSQ